MSTIRYQPDAREVEAAPSETLLEAAVRAEIPMIHTCGSLARCSTCLVAVLEGLENCTPRTDSEQAVADHLKFKPMMRLACQTRATGPVVLRRVVIDPEDEALARQSAANLSVETAGEERDLAIMFADIRGFTRYAENLLPYDVIHTLNRYYSKIGPVIQNHGGVIDNYMGDGILAVFGLQEESNHSVTNAIRAGLGMLDAVEQMKPYFHALHGRGFDIGIGLHYGRVVVGSLGWGTDKRCTVVGATVNFASRVEVANKTAGTRFLISEAAYQRAGKEVQVNECPPWEFKGLSGLKQIYEVLGAG